MPFKVQNFQNTIEQVLEEPALGELSQACQDYGALTSSTQKTRSIRAMMDVLDRQVDEPKRWAIMEACGRQCIGASILDRARRLQQEASDLDDLLARLNEAHIGGGHFIRQGQVIHAAYDRCYCGSVSQSRERFSATYCHCSCGWYRQLFETLLEKPVEVDLLSSILQGDERCQFLIRIQ